MYLTNWLKFQSTKKSIAIQASNNIISTVMQIAKLQSNQIKEMISMKRPQLENNNNIWANVLLERLLVPSQDNLR